jgi:hypothetical protein
MTLNGDFQFSISVAFILTFISILNTDDYFTSVYSEEKNTNVKYIDFVKTGCENVKLQTILDSLSGDGYLKQENFPNVYKSYISQSGVRDPLERLKLLLKISEIRLDISDENAPYLASLLLEHAGFSVLDGCKLY